MGNNEFRARSGRKVQIRDNGTVTFDHANGYLSPETAMDAEEFFQAQRDIELGRWRWPENPDYVVYRDTSGDAIVFREHMPVGGILYRRGDDVVDMESGAAHAFFAAHPEQKPWQDAKPGETWRLTVNDRDPQKLDLTFNVVGVTDHIQARFARPQVSGEQMEYPLDSPAIIDGFCIWPQLVDAEIVEDES